MEYVFHYCKSKISLSKNLYTKIIAILKLQVLGHPICNISRKPEQKKQKSFSSLYERAPHP